MSLQMTRSITWTTIHNNYYPWKRIKTAILSNLYPKQMAKEARFSISHLQFLHITCKMAIEQFSALVRTLTVYIYKIWAYQLLMHTYVYWFAFMHACTPMYTGWVQVYVCSQKFDACSLTLDAYTFTYTPICTHVNIISSRAFILQNLSWDDTS